MKVYGFVSRLSDLFSIYKCNRIESPEIYVCMCACLSYASSILFLINVAFWVSCKIAKCKSSYLFSPPPKLFWLCMASMQLFMNFRIRFFVCYRNLGLIPVFNIDLHPICAKDLFLFSRKQACLLLGRGIVVASCMESRRISRCIAASTSSSSSFFKYTFFTFYGKNIKGRQRIL